MDGLSETRKKLVEAARVARQRAFAPYSGFSVGAALECSDGAVFTGCNIENSSYGLSLCAERVAIFKAVSEGRRDFVRIAVIADSHTPVRPCGACRQVISDLFGSQAEVIMANISGAVELRTVGEILPIPFDRSFL
ncbi:MAG: cytidine deaminase [Acidobacteria bacterium]|nr:cytidine deaminase [Acidobacteriota bacterium]